MNDTVTDIAAKVVDWVMAVLPRQVPNKAVLQRCKLISHRGEHDNTEVMENTLRAYEIARTNGVWGIETDIRWTRDLVPVVCHDPDCRRVFGNSMTIGEVNFAELRDAVPLIPSLAELVEEFGGNTHLMIEIKAEAFPHKQRQKQILLEHLASLTPGEDYHLLALDPGRFELVDFLPRKFCLPVAETNTRIISKASLAGGYGGLTGHYLLLNKQLKQRHEQAGQQIGTGFIGSRNCLYRELNRGVEWIFSNNAVKLQQLLDHALRMDERS